MREIKFRAWDKQWKRMSAPMELFKNGQSFFFFKGFGTRAPTHESLIVVEYISLNDKNGKEICEGDVVKITNLECQTQKAELRGVVIFSYASFGVKINRVVEWKGYNVKPLEMLWFLNIIDMKEIEVIGNIYENPELLEEESC